MKPRIFIGSSSGGLDVARALEEHLVRDAEPLLWKSDVFKPGETYIESLENALKGVEMAILVVTPDDDRTKRGDTDKVPRDNVVLEIGLFMGRLGRRRSLVVCDPRFVELPTDLLGVSSIEYDSKRSDGNLVAALSPAATKVLRAIKELPKKTEDAPAPERSFLADPEAMYNAIVAWPASASSTVTVQTPDTDWVWRIFPTLLHWRLNNAEVCVYAPPIPARSRKEREEKARRQLLRELGIGFHEQAGGGADGFFLEGEYDEDDVAIILNADPAEGEAIALRYEGRQHGPAIAALKAQLHERDNRGSGLAHVPELINQDIDEVLRRLRKGVHQYSQAGVEMSETTVRTADLELMTPFARAYKYGQIRRLRGSYETRGVPAFSALAVKLASGASTIVTPPVVEIHDGRPVVLEGTTRAAFCARKGIDDFHCIEVRNVEEEPPGSPVPISEVTVAERTLTQRQRTKKYKRTQYRLIERAIHPY